MKACKRWDSGTSTSGHSNPMTELPAPDVSDCRNGSEKQHGAQAQYAAISPDKLAKP
jgi:hypothetical protein